MFRLEAENGAAFRGDRSELLHYIHVVKRVPIKQHDWPTDLLPGERLQTVENCLSCSFGLPCKPYEFDCGILHIDDSLEIAPQERR